MCVYNNTHKHKGEARKEKRGPTLILNPTIEALAEIVNLSLDGSMNTVETSKGNLGKLSEPGTFHVNEEFADKFVDLDEAPKTKLCRKCYEEFGKFQDTWAARFPWAELYRGFDGLYEFVRCIVCSTITGKPKIMGPK